MNSQQVTLLVLLDFSAAFDTVNHSMLLRVVCSRLGIGGTVLTWLGSYLSGHSQRFILDGIRSPTYQLNSGVPQGSCPGLFFKQFFKQVLVSSTQQQILSTCFIFSDRFRLITQTSSGSLNKMDKRNLFYT